MGLRELFNKQVIHLHAPYDDETALIVRQLTNPGLKKIAVFHQNDAYGKAGLDGVSLALDKLGLKPVATATVKRNIGRCGIRSARHQRHRARRGSPDQRLQVLCGLNPGGAGHRLRRHVLELLLVPRPLLMSWARMASAWWVSQVMPSPHSAARPIAREFAQAARKAGNVQANFSSMDGMATLRPAS